MTILQRFYEQITSQIFGSLEGNEWYTANADIIQGAVSVALTCLCLVGIICLVIGVFRFLCGIVGVRR